MAKNCGLLLDRDGVINDDTGYVGTVERFSFLPGLFPFLRTARDRGFRLAILTNQAGVAHGYYTKDDFYALTAHMLDVLKKEGIDIALVLACFEHTPSADPALARQSYWRKPKPGMVLEAVRRLNLDPARSAFIGDRVSDMEAAEAGGIRTRLLFTQATVEAPAGSQLIRSYDEALVALTT
jgi:D-glycero-D-manno-heptose 1,7-bisphosphate phosphatase